MVEQVQSLSEITTAPAFRDAEGREVRIRYAPEGAEVSNVYFTNGYASPLALGQLVAAVLLRAAAANETRAIFKLNVLNAATSKQKMASYIDRIVCDELLKQVEDRWGATIDPYDSKTLPAIGMDLRTDPQLNDLTEQVREFLYHPRSKEFEDNPNAYAYLRYECGILTSDEEAKLSGYDAFITLHERMRPAMEDSTRSSAITQAELQSAVSRRDVAYTTSANLVKAITGSTSGTAAVLRI